MRSHPRQFTLRGLLAVMTLCAVLLAIVTRVPAFAIVFLLVMMGTIGVFFAVLMAAVGALALLTAAVCTVIPGLKDSAFQERVVLAGLWVVLLIVPATAVLRLLYVVAALPSY